MIKSIGPCVLASLLLTAACGGDDSGQTASETASETVGASTSESSSGSTATPTTSPATSADDGSSGTSGSSTSSTTATETLDDTTVGDTTGIPSECDYEAIDGLIVIEAENLPITEDWEIQTTEPGYYAEGYIGWTRGSFNNDPTHGVIEVTIHVAQAGRYRLRWRNRIGMGTNTTEHNDTWVRFPDASDFYGLQLSGSDELRRYPRPLCEDAAAMAAIEALPQVAGVACVQGSSVDGWLKVYSSGANDWSWSTRTNDNDAFDVMVEFAAPGDYSFMMAARADWHLIDRIVIHEESLDDAAVQAPEAPETPCE